MVMASNKIKRYLSHDDIWDFAKHMAGHTKLTMQFWLDHLDDVLKDHILKEE